MEENVNMNYDPWNITGRASEEANTELQEQVRPTALPPVPVKVESISDTKLRDDFGLVSMITGIISLVLGFSPWGILGIVFGILAKRGKTSNSHSTVGIVCSAISFALSLIVVVLVIVFYVGIIFTALEGEGFFDWL